MRVEIISKNYKVTDRLREIIEKKTEKFSRYFEDDAYAKIVLKEVGKGEYAMEITVFFGDSTVRSEVRSDNMYNNIDIALPKIEGQIRKYRTKLGKMKKTVLDGDSLYQQEKTPAKELARTKIIDLQKSSVEDAIAQMELLDHDFFVFVNEKSGMVNVVYKRTDGNAGLLDLVY